MKTFKDTKYGDLTGKTYNGDIFAEDIDGIESLEGAPKVVNGDFNCYKCNKLKTLEGAPEIVKGKFDCNSCENLETLKGAPRVVEGDFKCALCVKLETLKYSPEIVKGDFVCSICKNLKTLEGAPEEIGEGGNAGFYCHWSPKLESLDFMPKRLKFLSCNRCPKLKSFDPLLKCDIEEIKTDDDRLLDDYNKKKKVVDKYGYDKAKEVFDMLDDLL